MKCIGFESLEQLLADVGAMQRVYALLLQTQKPTSLGISYVTHFVLVQVPVGEDVYYFRQILARHESFAGTLDEPAHQRKAAAEDAFRLICDYLQNLGHQIVPAVIAMPTDLTYLDGLTRCLRFNSEKQTYERA